MARRIRSSSTEKFIEYNYTPLLNGTSRVSIGVTSSKIDAESFSQRRLRYARSA